MNEISVYPFEMELPALIPDSLKFSAVGEATTASIRYQLVAQLTPMNDVDWGNKAKGISSLVTELPV